MRPRKPARETLGEFCTSLVQSHEQLGLFRILHEARAESIGPDRRRPLSVGQVEIAEVPEVSRRVAPADARQELLRQGLDDFLATLGMRFAALHVLDDLAPDVSVREHLAVDGAGDA